MAGGPKGFQNCNVNGSELIAPRCSFISGPDPELIITRRQVGIGGIPLPTDLSPALIKIVQVNSVFAIVRKGVLKCGELKGDHVLAMIQHDFFFVDNGLGEHLPFLNPHLLGRGNSNKNNNQYFICLFNGFIVILSSRTTFVKIYRKCVEEMGKAPKNF